MTPGVMDPTDRIIDIINEGKPDTLSRIAEIVCGCDAIAARPLSEWHEDHGAVTWWKFPVDEPAWIGQPGDSDWPGYHTHWTPHPALPGDTSQLGDTEK